MLGAFSVLFFSPSQPVLFMIIRLSTVLFSFFLPLCFSGRLSAANHVRPFSVYKLSTFPLKACFNPSAYLFLAFFSQPINGDVCHNATCTRGKRPVSSLSQFSFAQAVPCARALTSSPFITVSTDVSSLRH